MIIAQEVLDQTGLHSKVMCKPIRNNLLYFRNDQARVGYCFHCVMDTKVGLRKDHLRSHSIFSGESNVEQCWSCGRQLPGKYNAGTFFYQDMIESARVFAKPGQRHSLGAVQQSQRWLATRIPYKWIDSFIDNYPNVPFILGWSLEDSIANIFRFKISTRITQLVEIFGQNHTQTSILGITGLSTIKSPTFVACLKEYTRIMDNFASHIFGNTVNALRLDAPHINLDGTVLAETEPPEYELL